jgi:ABC-type nickel/cobalt efflux system permease component RcnA
MKILGGFRIGIVAAATLATASILVAHPVPSQAHLRTIDVRLRATELCIFYRLEVDQLTALRDLLDAGKEKGLTKPAEFYDSYLKWQAPLLVDQLFASLDGQTVTLRCVEQKYEILDHLRCDFIFIADWSISGEHRLEFRDDTFPKEPGRVKLTLTQEDGITTLSRTAPSGLLQARGPLDLQPGDDARLRTIRANFRRDGETSKSVAPIVDRDIRPSPGGSSLVALLDAPHGMAMLLLLAAVFGAAHALTPGHGKTMVAAYLVGERGTARHAVVLGLVTTITHTGAVLLLAAGLYWKYRDAAPATISAVLGFVGGLLIAGLGLWLLLRRLSGQADHVHLGGGGHTHNADGTVTFHDREAVWGRLIILGISGGIVPCWDAVLLLMFAISAQLLWLALPLLLAFSAGLASVLVAIGLAVVYTKGIAGARWSESRFWKALPLFSAAALIILGILLCRDSLNLPTTG